MTCARVRPKRTKQEEKLYKIEFYEKEHTKPLFTSKKILTVQNLYAYHCTLEIFKVLKFRIPVGLLESFNISKRKPSLLLTPDPSIYFLYKSARLWNNYKKVLLDESLDFSTPIGAAKARIKRHLLEIQKKDDPNIWNPTNYAHTFI